MTKFLIPFFILFHLQSLAQEVINPLNSRFVESDLSYYNSYNKLNSFPFFDDFSNKNIVNNNWTDRNIFINDNYAIDPISMGVATFDGLDSNGFAYDISAPNSWGIADFLSSRKIDLSNKDSVYMMFFYQPQGIGDFPQYQDSLVLEFLDDSLKWNNVWSVKGNRYYPFTKKILFINQNKYLHSNFRFRFYNYATLSGNFDHWNLDYVKIDEFKRTADTMDLNDVSFTGKHESLLKRYNQMPWRHFVNNEIYELKDSINIQIRNNDASINVDYKYFVYDEYANQLSTFPNLGWRNYSINDFNLIGNFSHSPPVLIDDNIFNSFQIDSASFEIKHVIKTGSDDYKYNDTIHFIQHFNSSYAYDDGSAESAYGINVSDAMGAMQFKLNRPDTLRAIQFYFPQMLDSISNLNFYLTVWNNNNGKPGDILYSKLESPKHTRKSKFQTILIDSLFQLSGIFYVGWKQTTDDLLNIGLDLNNYSNDFMFYNFSGSWLNSQYQGSWMIRPIVSNQRILLSTNETSKYKIKIWPNPTNNFIYVSSDREIKNIEVFDVFGKEVHKKINFNNNLSTDIKNLCSGIYFFKIYFKDNFIIKKIMFNE